VVDLFAGGDVTCAIVDSVKRIPVCWGTGHADLFGTPGPHAPTRLPHAALDGASQLALAPTFTCAVDASGSVQCFGDNAHGQLGQGDTNARPSPTPVALPGLPSPLELDAGEQSVCAFSEANAALQCWGRSVVTNATVFAPTSELAVGPISRVAVGAQSRCYVSSGRVYCWGANALGQLGDGSPGDRLDPLPSKPVIRQGGLQISKGTTVGVGATHACVLTSTPSVFCWGGNDVGQLGVGAPDGNPHPSAEQVPSTGAGGLLSVGDRFSCLADGSTVRCWGSLEDGSGGSFALGSPQIISLPGSGAIIRLVAGNRHACALDNQGRVFCWGANDKLQAGSPCGAGLLAGCAVSFGP
jgi:hypothetical protein